MAPCQGITCSISDRPNIHRQTWNAYYRFLRPSEVRAMASVLTINSPPLTGWQCIRPNSFIFGLYRRFIVHAYQPVCRAHRFMPFIMIISCSHIFLFLWLRRCRVVPAPMRASLTSVHVTFQSFQHSEIPRSSHTVCCLCGKDSSRATPHAKL